jgi:hypothetical protein
LKETTMSDSHVLKHIEELVREEQRLRDQGSASDTERARLSDLEVELDQYWDLLRRRRANREFGNDPGEAQIRPAKIVEGYEG